VLATWDIRSENQPGVHNGASFFAKACEMRVQSTLIELITTGSIAQQFKQVVLIPHQPAFDREAFHYHGRMEGRPMPERVGK
jgi:hypothetical protein